MGKNLANKLLERHSAVLPIKQGKEVPIQITQVIAPDDDVLVSFLQFESMGIPRVKTKLAVCYMDHNTLQMGHESANDQAFFRTFGAKYGMHVTKPGTGICHQVHLERFAVPGESLLGADSHTPTAGALGMLAIGAGGLDMASIMAGSQYYLNIPQVMLIRLKGKLPPYTSAKDIALEVMRRLGVRGGGGKIIEYGGPGVKTLSVPERATIANLGTEAGAVSSIFPSDQNTLKFLKLHGRGDVWKELKADVDAYYDETMEIDLSAIVPLVAKPDSPGNVCSVSEVQGLKVDQVVIGGCANSSVRDLTVVAEILKGKKIPPAVSTVISPGSRRVLYLLERAGVIAEMIRSGVRVLEPACGPCIGLGQTPPSGGVTLRTYNRNFKGRCGTPDAKIYLVSPETAAVSALSGEITDPRTFKVQYQIQVSENIGEAVDLYEDMILLPDESPEGIEIIKGPNICNVELPCAIKDNFQGEVLIKAGNDITTDQIIAAGAKGVPLRSNIPELSNLVFESVDPAFAKRAKKLTTYAGVIVAGDNYGQGSARDHAALCPRYLGIQVVLAKSFARIHISNLINFGILPLQMNGEDYDKTEEGDVLIFEGIRKVSPETTSFNIKNITKGYELTAKSSMSTRQKTIVLEGGLLNLVKKENAMCSASDSDK
ncbi:MAG: aconitate hydratase [Deltaproteobacteria bacterium]|nr:aconitate hydratase [Deltaproteobacteria bacterium]